MKICPNCQQPTHIASLVELKCNGNLIHSVELCPKCRDNFLNNVPLYTPRVQDVLPNFVEKELPVGTKIVTQEQLWDILQGRIDPDDLPPIQEKEHEPCPNCGLTEKDLYTSKKFRCHECYNHFEDLIIDFAEQVHGNKQQDKEEQIKLLKMKLTRAKEHADFKEAASLVNQLKELE